MKEKHFIDSHKGFNIFAILALMGFYNQWENTTAWVYLALHGSYGILWNLKSQIFPDKSWERETSIFYGLFIWAGLSLYWVTPWLICSQSIEAPAWLLAACISVYTLGVFLHFSADMQKYMHMRLKPGHLMTEIMVEKCRNTNYFGEFLIYGGFSALAMHWAPFAVLLLFISVIWIPNMVKKDRSLSRYPEFANYKHRSNLFFPKLF